MKVLKKLKKEGQIYWVMIMSSLKRNNNDLNILDVSSTLRPLKIKKDNILISVYDIDTIKRLIDNKFNKKYELLSTRIDNIDDSGEDGDILYRDFDNLLDEIMYKYKDYLSDKDIVKYGKKLINLRTKLLMILENNMNRRM
jgi:hypothetical protein